MNFAYETDRDLNHVLKVLVNTAAQFGASVEQAINEYGFTLYIYKGERWDVVEFRTQYVSDTEKVNQMLKNKDIEDPVVPLRKKSGR